MSGDDDEVREILTGLKVVAQVRAGARISTRGAAIEVDARSGLTQAAARWWGGESRQTNIDQLSKLVDTAIGVVNGAAAGAAAERLRGELRHAAEGVRNLKTTYKGCSVSAARLDVLLENIEAARGGDGGSG